MKSYLNLLLVLVGRKSACTVGIDKTGFTLQHIRICEGQTVAWEWEAEEGAQGFNVTQVRERRLFIIDYRY